MRVREVVDTWKYHLEENPDGLKQGKDFLKKELDLPGVDNEVETYCCLGVLAKILIDNGLIENGWDNALLYGGEISYLPYEIADKIGLSHDDQKFLARLNDTRDFNFQQISYVVEGILRDSFQNYDEVPVLKHRPYWNEEAEGEEA